MTPETFVPPSASKLQIADTCPASMALPRFKEEAGEAAEVGTAIHEFIEVVADAVKKGATLERARDDALAARVTADCYPRLEALDLAALGLRPESLREVGFSLMFSPDPVVTYHGTGHAHGTITARPGEIVGVLDCVTDYPDLDLVEIDDYKTGHLPVPAKGNLQLLFGAVCAARHFGRSKARVRIVKLPEDGQPRIDSEPLDVFDLDLGLLKLAALVDSGREQVRRLAAGESLDYVQGASCRYCASFNACAPSMRAIVVMAREPLNVDAEITALIATGTDEDAAKAALALEKWETVAKRIKVAIMSRARNRPIPFPDGTVLGERTIPKTTFDGEDVYAVIDNTFGGAAASLTVKKKATKKGIRAAAKLLATCRTEAARRADPKAKKIAIGTVEDELFALLKERGASKTGTKKKLDRHKPGDTTDEEEEDES